MSKKIDGSFELQPKNIEILPGLTEPDVFQTIQQLPGISSTDETISNITVRGGSHDQNLFLWNDIKLYQTGHFYGLISVLNPNTASKVSVIKNGSSAFYSESVSSTVCISTANDNIENTSSIGFNMLNLDFNTKQKTSEKSTLEISGRRSYTDFVDSPTYKNYKKRIFQNTEVTNLSNNQNIDFNSSEKFYFYDASVQFKQEIKENTTLFANFITISNQLDLNQSKEENNTLIERNSFLTQQSLGGSLVFKYKLELDE
ncbi:MAG: Plug domain-containing protein [Flavobacterium sp.]|nr:Plug domain-containing protein [Flavobacterium sp.]